MIGTLRIAVRALARNKLRSFLTTLGVVIGTGAVIAMVSIGEGAKSQVEKAFASMGTNMLLVLPGSTTAGGYRGGFGSQPTLTWADLKAIQAELPSVRLAAPQLRANATVQSDELNWSTQVNGTTPEFFAIRDWRVAEGDTFTQSDVDAGTKVVLLGRTVVDKLYGEGVSPVGQSVRIKGVPFTVIGVLAAKGQSPNGQDFDDSAYIPSSTFNTRIQGGLQKYLNGNIIASADPAAGTARAERDLTALLRERHRIGAGREDDFSIRNLAEMASAQQEGTKTLTTLLASIAAVSLLVGGIGIMNIMLVSVTERTREIGVRMAVGARPRDILGQFLVEALTLSLAGGLIGVMLGIVTAQRLAAAFGWPLLVRADIVLIAVAVSAVVGVGFGLYPARRASQLDPIEALRYE